MQLLEEFEDAATNHYDDEKPYIEARRNLVRRLNQLASAQRKLSKLRKQIRHNPSMLGD